MVMDERCRKNVIAWWGSFDEQSGATIGDHDSVAALSKLLIDCGVHHHVLSKKPCSFSSAPVVRNPIVANDELENIFFVCGPLFDDENLLAFLHTHPKAKKIALNVSLLANQYNTHAQFDRIFPREFNGISSFDFALARNDVVWDVESTGRAAIGLCLVGAQWEYSSHKPALHERASDLLTRALSSFDLKVVNIDTVLRDNNNENDIRSAFASVAAVVTTRMHGALYALGYSKPIVALDQVVAGGKVSAVVSALNWPLLFRIETATHIAIADAIHRAISGEQSEQVLRSRKLAFEFAADALKQAKYVIL